MGRGKVRLADQAGAPYLWTMRFVVAFLALALIALPFGMGSMMSHAAGQGHEMRAAHGGHHGDAPAAPHKGKGMDFAVCGACLSLPSQAAPGTSPNPKRIAPPLPILKTVDGQSPLPAIPPPRA
jgi:hypothetical protein